MGAEGSLPHSQQHVTCPYPAPNQTSPYPRPTSWRAILSLSYLLHVTFQVVSFQVVSFPQTYLPKLCMHFLRRVRAICSANPSVLISIHL